MALARPFDLTKLARDAAYVAVGFGVLNFQRAQVRRRELAKALAAQVDALEASLDEARGQLGRLAREVDGRLEPMVANLESRFDAVEARLPGPAGNAQGAPPPRRPSAG